MATNAQLLAALKQPGAYKSTYQSRIDTLLNNILNREKFSYDFNADPLYRQYAEQYTQRGRRAMQDTTGQVAALTGGYGNSYAASAGNQAYQEYLTQLNDKIPDLYQAALDRYNSDYDRDVKALGLLNDAENSAYGRYRDTVQDYQTNRDFYHGANQDDIANNQWTQNFNYQKQRDAVGDKQWQQEFNLKKANAASVSASGGGGRSGGGGGGRRSGGGSGGSGGSNWNIADTATPSAQSIAGKVNAAAASAKNAIAGATNVLTGKAALPQIVISNETINLYKRLGRGAAQSMVDAGRMSPTTFEILAQRLGW